MASAGAATDSAGAGLCPVLVGPTAVGKTVRLDYVHAGTTRDETVAFQGLRREGPWPASRVNLVDRLFATDLPLSCPHGRPTLIQFPLEDLEKRFGRR